MQPSKSVSSASTERAVGERLHELRGGDLALRQQHDRADAGRGGIGRQRRRRVAGRRAGDGADRLAVAIICRTTDTSTVIPRSLKDPVCELPHCLTHRSSMPSWSPNRRPDIRFVPPSSIDTMFSRELRGDPLSFPTRRCRTPGRCACLAVVERAHPRVRGARAQRVRSCTTSSSSPHVGQPMDRLVERMGAGQPAMQRNSVRHARTLSVGHGFGLALMMTWLSFTTTENSTPFALYCSMIFSAPLRVRSSSAASRRRPVPEVVADRLLCLHVRRVQRVDVGVVHARAVGASAPAATCRHGALLRMTCGRLGRRADSAREETVPASTRPAAVRASATRAASPATEPRRAARRVRPRVRARHNRNPAGVSGSAARRPARRHELRSRGLRR